MVSISDRSLPVVNLGQPLLSETVRSDLPGAPRTGTTTGKYSLRLLVREWYLISPTAYGKYGGWIFSIGWVYLVLRSLALQEWVPSTGVEMRRARKVFYISGSVFRRSDHCLKCLLGGLISVIRFLSRDRNEHKQITVLDVQHFVQEPSLVHGEAFHGVFELTGCDICCSIPGARQPEI